VNVRQPQQQLTSQRRSATFTTAEFRRYVDLRALNIEEAPDVPGQTEFQQQ